MALNFNIAMKNLYLFFLLAFNLNFYCQDTVGTLTYTTDAYNGYTLFSSGTSTETYLINNCGEVINQWTSNYTPGNSLYLLENGNLLRTGKIDNPSITIGGIGGIIELFSWDNTLLWQYTYSTSEVAQHHDIFPLPNGNILMLALSVMTGTEAIQAGRDPLKLSEGRLFNEQIIELEPLGANQANIVWEWNLKDHLIQDIDNTKDNFGVVADNPQLLNINFLNNNSSLGPANWIHANSIQYNETLDQIILSSRLLSEIYIIDHSTTTSEAASHSGGNYNKGGDFLYRWGNPKAYNHGDSDDQQLFGQHFPHWIEDGFTDAGKIILFNNGNAREVELSTNTPINYSSIDVIDPSETSGVYAYDAINGYSPTSPSWTYTDPIDVKLFYSPILSGAQRLPNGNTLICNGILGKFFEIDSNGDTVWEYVNPDSSSGIIKQGEPPSSNVVFRATKLPLNYPAFSGKNLTPGAPIQTEVNFNCSILSNLTVNISKILLHPTPVKDILNIKSQQTVSNIRIYNILGKVVKEFKSTYSLNLSNLKQGLYVIQFQIDGAIINKKIIKT